jgi:hypothetical protein
MVTFGGLKAKPEILTSKFAARPGIAMRQDARRADDIGNRRQVVRKRSA